MIHMKVMTMTFSVLLVALALVGPVFAQEAILNLSDVEPVYTLEDTILVYATVHNTRSVSAAVWLETLLTNEGGTYPTMIIPFEFQLEPEENRTTLIYNISVDENFISDRYTLSVRVLFGSQEVAAETLDFNVSGTLEEMIFETKTCKDQACIEKSKVFVLDEDIYLDYESSVPDPKITATLTFPDQTTQQRTLPILLKAEQIGTYKLEISASKEGYRAVGRVELFSVIESEPEITYAGVCNADGICSGEENRQNCPQDCLSGEADSYCDGLPDGKCDPDCAPEEDLDCVLLAPGVSVEAIYIAVLAVIVIIVGIVFWRKRHSQESLEKGHWAPPRPQAEACGGFV